MQQLEAAADCVINIIKHEEHQSIPAQTQTFYINK